MIIVERTLQSPRCFNEQTIRSMWWKSSVQVRTTNDFSDNPRLNHRLSFVFEQSSNGQPRCCWRSSMRMYWSSRNVWVSWRKKKLGWIDEKILIKINFSVISSDGKTYRNYCHLIESSKLARTEQKPTIKVVKRKPCDLGSLKMKKISFRRKPKDIL